MKLAIVTDGVNRLLSLTPENTKEAFELGEFYAENQLEILIDRGNDSGLHVAVKTMVEEIIERAK
mgnify:CR=1 FL=1